jgi:hypothetical protein
MAVFTAQISSQITKSLKDEVREVLSTDRQRVLGTSEADVIRLALEVGLRDLAGWTQAQRIEAYARQRRGLVLELTESE